jgi:hypothetical protein
MIWKTDVAPTGALKAAILADKELPKASWLSDEVHDPTLFSLPRINT